MNFKDEIEKLVQLQQLDSQIYELTQQKDVEKPAVIKQLSDQFNQTKSSLLKFEEALKAEQLQRKNIELDLKSKEEAVQKSQAQLYQLKTNKEYQAKISEIESLKADISLLEETAIKNLEAIDTAEKDLAAEKEKMAGIEKEFSSEKEKIEAQIKELDAKISEFAQKKERYIKDIDPTIYATYEKILKTRDGLAIVPVQNECCSACNMWVTPQTINEIKSLTGLVFCGSCLRILYIPEE